MSPALPGFSGRQAIRTLETLGYEEVSRRGSHVKLRNESGRTVIVPDHRELARGTLASILRQAGVPIEDSSTRFDRVRRQLRQPSRRDATAAISITARVILSSIGSMRCCGPATLMAARTRLVRSRIGPDTLSTPISDSPRLWA